MNARLYDPLIHRFLQIDNYIQDPGNTQNYNQYGYVLNNPLLNTDITGNTCDCPGGGINVGPGTQTGTSFDIEQFGKDYGIDKWLRKNANFHNWSNSVKSAGNFLSDNAKSVGNYVGRNIKSIGRALGLGGDGPPPNLSTYANIQMPTQHSSFGFNWTYLSEGKPGERFIYEFYNGFYTTGQYFIGRGVGDYSMRNLNGSATNTDEAVWGLIGAVSSLSSIGEAKVALSELKATQTNISLVQANRAAGNLFRDELAAALEAEGRVVGTEVFKRTPFGPRYMDIDVWHNGVNLGGIEAKVGRSRYLPLQKLKDAWLGANGYPVQLIRKPKNW